VWSSPLGGGTDAIDVHHSVIIVGMPIYEYRCEECGNRSTSLLPSYSSPDPPCPHCGKPALKRLVSTFATVSSGESGGDDFDGGGGEDYGGGDDDFGGGGDFGGDDDF
jgi:putative FmdB family regulatory protein